MNRATVEAGLDGIRAAPRDAGTVDLIVRRPAVDEREVIDEGALDVEMGLIGDSWQQRGSSMTPDGSAHPDMQLNVMSSRVIALVAPNRDDWPRAGDQLFVDLDLSEANLPPGTRLALGSAVIEVTAEPHTGCAKFAQRFGIEAARFVNTERALRLRGLNAKVVSPGIVRTGDVVTKL